MDLGTANTIIISDDKIVVDEPSVVALDRRTDKMIAVGEKAKMMYEKTNDNIRTIRPLRDGVIADFTACEQMMRGLIKMVHTGRRFFSPSLRMVIGVPSGSTEVELRAVRDSAEHAGGRDVYLIFEPMAAAIGIGLDVEAPEGNMVVDIGGGSTEIAVISLGGIVSNNSIRTAGDDLTAEIQEYMSKQHNVKVSERMAERIKIHVGSALTDLGDQAPEDYVVHGPNKVTALPMEVPVCYQEIAHCLDRTIAKIENAVLGMLMSMPRWTPGQKDGEVVRTGYGTWVGVPEYIADSYTKPEFVGGVELLLKYLAVELKKYDISQYRGKPVRVLARFVVDTDGSIDDVEIVKPGRKLMNDAVVAVLKGMPKWKPGTIDGKPVRVRYTLPVRFGKV